MTATATTLPAGATTGADGQTIYSGFAGSSATSTGSSSGGASVSASLYVGQTFGLFFVAAGLVGGFAVLL